jgi:thioredoxin reductase (NADPH)
MSDITVYGAPWCPDCRRAKTFLTSRKVPFDWVDIDEDPSGLAKVQELQSGGLTIPTIVFSDGSMLLEPSDEELAVKLGISVKAERDSYDLVIIGGGPAGIAASIYAAREGINSVVIDAGGLGGNAAVTERIDNYPGFPEGIGGRELMDRFVTQARRYDVELVSAARVQSVERDATDEDLVVKLANGQEIVAHAVLVATGSTYRHLGIPGEEELIGAGVHFCATCDGPFYKGAEEVLVVGGGNSALEEGLFLSGFAKRVRIVERGPQLTASALLQDKIRSHPRFEVHTGVALEAFIGDGRIEKVLAKDLESGQELVWKPAGVFVFIGLDPNSAFLASSAELDRWGFISTDEAYRTSLPGLYAAGDVRSGSTKQLAAAVGEGVAALLSVRMYLQQHSHIPRIDIND